MSHTDGTDRLTNDDRVLLKAILEPHDDQTYARLLHAYYEDTSRADRTPRMLLYLHLGTLVGIVGRLTQHRG